MLTWFGFQQSLQLGQAALIRPLRVNTTSLPFADLWILNIDLCAQRMPEQCKRNTNRNQLKKLESVGDEMPTFRQLPNLRQVFSAGEDFRR
jgi:hypothetical protein